MPTLDEIVARADKVHGYMFPRELRWLCETARGLPAPVA